MTDIALNIFASAGVDTKYNLYQDNYDLFCDYYDSLPQIDFRIIYDR